MESTSNDFSLYNEDEEWRTEMWVQLRQMRDYEPPIKHPSLRILEEKLEATCLWLIHAMLKQRDFDFVCVLFNNQSRNMNYASHRGKYYTRAEIFLTLYDYLQRREKAVYELQKHGYDLKDDFQCETDDAYAELARILVVERAISRDMIVEDERYGRTVILDSKDLREGLSAVLYKPLVFTWNEKKRIKRAQCVFSMPAMNTLECAFQGCEFEWQIL